LLIGPGLKTGRVGATLSYAALDIAVHIPINRIACKVIVKPEAPVTIPRQWWLTFWKGRGTISSEIPIVVMGLALPSDPVAAGELITP